MMQLPLAKRKRAADHWLGDIPAQWEELPLKLVANIDNSGSYGDDPEKGEVVLPVATTAQIDSDGRFQVERMSPRGFKKVEAERYGCRPGDILVVKSSGSIFQVISGKAGFVDEKTPEFVFSNFLMRVIPNESRVAPKFLYFLLISNLTRERVKRMVAGTTYPNLRVGEYTSANLPIPPRSEQDAIVAFLDRKLEQIDRFIAAKQRLIALLKEQKTALINRAVTKGLNPDAPMKHSGIDWLGEIPAHWEVRQSHRLFTVKKERASAEDVQLSATQAYGVIEQARYEELIGRKIVKLNMHQDQRKFVEIGDFIISMRSFQGGIERAWATGGIRSSYVVMKPAEAVDRDYYQFLLKCHRYIAALQTTTDFIRDGQDMTFDDFRKVPLPLPPKVEQGLIAAHIKKSIERFETQEVRIRQECELAQELRTTLISDAVTGKLTTEIVP